MKITHEDVIRAQNELAQKTCQQIEIETAIKWGARAIAAFRNWQSSGGDVKWFSLMQEFSHEAVEHAASAAVVGFADDVRCQMAMVFEALG
jgi:hypothetical protein